jgi:DNA-directed RNA polymerase subunit RPC12/RpoP
MLERTLTAVCSNCGYEFPKNCARQACPECGSTIRTFGKPVHITQHSVLSLHGLALGMRRQWKWPWVAATAALALMSLGVAFFTWGWVSVGASAAFFVLTTWTGYKASQLIPWGKYF